MQRTKAKQSKPPLECLRCDCGNSRRFLEIMAYESHVVDGDMNYVRLDDAGTEEYRCCDCGAVVEPRPVGVNT
jgi:hypothetical protein